MTDAKAFPVFETSRAAAEAVVSRLREAGYRALFAGGCVRDMLLGVEPHDFDVASSARPEEVQRLFPRALPVGAAFGVVLVLMPRAAAAAAAADETSAAGKDAPAESRRFFHIETATFRGEGEYRDGRRPDRVWFTDEQADARRRDFTVNGLFYDPVGDKVLDYVEGRADLQARRLRAIGNPAERFREDRLRLLRAVRFAAQLDFEIEAETFTVLREEAMHITEVSAERTREELERMLCGPRPRRAFELLRETGLLKVLLPEIEAFVDLEQPEQFHPEGDVWTHTMLMLDQLPAAAGTGETSPTLAWGVLLHDVGKPAAFERTPDRIRFNGHEKLGEETAGKILTRLRCDNRTTTLVKELVRRHMTFKDLPKMRPANLKRFLRLDNFAEHLELHRLDCRASHGKTDVYEFCTAKLKEFSEAELQPPPLLTGRDLLALDLPPGPLFGRILREVEERQLEGELNSREEALEFVRGKLPLFRAAEKDNAATAQNGAGPPAESKQKGENTCLTN